ncbi:MAG: asparagine synthase (glutamine-hydrolyzing) [Candidatus Competibacter sp.]|nr:asparagine synthase (glutamine-hydrolyzing) [Candidatus Contendobacter sp.]MDS4042266.1 asparagine synthase (glutamine-hydrolyzing) [Candidatus Competibacter sp.]
MCGIHGVLDLTGDRVDPTVLSAMGRVTVHRGPDDEGFHADGPCAIGMRRLSIIDLAGGHQPISNTDDTLWVVCNGEIYNFRGLRQELEACGHRFKTNSDSEVVLHGYARWGDDFVHRLNGMYGFALWDARRRRLLLGRDRLGIKPLYILNDGRRLAFASEAKALLALPGVRPELDPAALDAYLRLGYVPAPLSIFRGIVKLPPATLLSVENGRVEQHRYWRMPNEVDRSLSEDEWVGRARDRLEQSVRMQMVADVPLGAFLSGGLDSSSVVAFMARASDRPVKTYAIGFEGGAAESLYNELPYARRVAQLFGTEHREILVKPDVVSLLPRLIWHLDEPIADTAFITTFLVSEFARQDVTVILSGVGGDELFGGYRRYLGSHYQARFERLPGWLRRAAVAIGARLPADRHSSFLNVARLAKGFLASADLSFEERYRAYVEVFAPGEVEVLARRAGAPRQDTIAAAFDFARGDDDLNRMLAVDAETQLPDDLLLLTDKMTMATSLECRVPLLDHELVELAARMPEGIKIRRGRLKHVMKRALAGLLPDDILERRKRGFGTPMGAWLKHPLRPVLHRLLSPEAVAARGWFHHPPIMQLIAAHEQNRLDGTDRLLALLALEIWARLYLDGRTPDDLTQELREIAA